MDKTFVVRASFTDRRQGPGTGRTLEIKAATAPIAVGRAVRDFWKSLKTTERNDCLRDGMTIFIKERKEQANVAGS